jgi:hypothetical protein
MGYWVTWVHWWTKKILLETFLKLCHWRVTPQNRNFIAQFSAINFLRIEKITIELRNQTILMTCNMSFVCFCHNLLALMKLSILSGLGRAAELWVTVTMQNIKLCFSLKLKNICFLHRLTHKTTFTN